MNKQQDKRKEITNRKFADAKGKRLGLGGDSGDFQVKDNIPFTKL
jgi:hypothetical protein